MLELNANEIKHDIQLRLRWFGHVVRMTEQTMLKIMQTINDQEEGETYG